MIEISGRKIGSAYPPYLIAEISANHNGSIEKAKLCIQAAKESGADAVKMQTYTPVTMTIDCIKEDFIIKDGLWSGYKLFDLYNEAHTPFEWHEELFAYAKSLGITIFSTPFDETAVDLLEDLGAPAYKVASFEITDLPLIDYIARTGKPMLISTGMSSYDEIEEAVEAARSGGCQQLLLFHCISSYPATIENMNLRQITYLRNKYKFAIGLSDHTLSNTASKVAIALGASAIEKHFTLSRLDKGADSEFSVEPSEFAKLAQDAREVWASLGSENFTRPSIEIQNKRFRRSLYFVKSLIAGEEIKSHHVRRIRPGFGIACRHYDEIIGRRVKHNVDFGDPVRWEDLS